MKLRSLHGGLLLFLFAIHVPAAIASDEAYEWLEKMNQAARSLTYQGSFIYQHGSRMESMRILHRVQGGMVRERVVSLNGAVREVIRSGDEIRCYLPDENSVVVERRKADSRSFPSLLPQSVKELGANYQVVLGVAQRIAGRSAQEVSVMPRDDYRYGYQLWVDRKTGLLLKASLLDADGRAIEQFMFTHVEIGGSIPEAELEPHNHGKDYVWHREEREVAQPATGDAEWTVRELPPGFSLSMRSIRRAPARPVAVEHLVYSDGLAVVSVFIEKQDEDSKPAAAASESTRMGAVHARGRIVGMHHVTVVGEVPEITVDLISNSVAPVR